MRKTEKIDKEVIEGDWEDALIWVLHELQERDRFVAVYPERRSFS
jgi:hypothetical protein